MGTNYYLWENESVPTEENIEAGFHIGKDSAGWVFHFQAHEHVKDLKTMKQFTQLGSIYNEYGERLPYAKFWDIVSSSKEPFNGEPPLVLVDPDYPSEFDFEDYEESGYAWSVVDFC